MGLVYPNGMDYVCLFTPDGRATGTPLRLKCGKLTFPRDGIRLYAISGKLGKANESCHWLTLAFRKWAIRTVGVATWATRWRLIVIAHGRMMGLVYPNGMDYVCLFTPDGRATGTPLRLKCGKLTFPRDGIRLWAVGDLEKPMSRATG